MYALSESIIGLAIEVHQVLVLDFSSSLMRNACATSSAEVASHMNDRSHWHSYTRKSGSTVVIGWTSSWSASLY